MNTLSFRRKRNSGSEQLKREYLEWVNEWLCRRIEPTMRTFSLQHDFKNGVVFAALIELIGGVKLYGVENKPMSKSQQDENVNSCLEFLAQRGLQTDTVPDSTGITSGDELCTMSLIHQISKLDPHSKLKPVTKAVRPGTKLDRQHSERSTYNQRHTEFNKSATIGPCMAKSLPVLNRSCDSLTSTDMIRRSAELLSPTRKRPNSFDLSPNTPVIPEDGSDLGDEGIIQIGQRKIRESQLNSASNNNENHSTQNTHDVRRNTPLNLSLRRNVPIMDNVMVKINNGNHSIRHSKPLHSGPVSPLYPMSPTQTYGQTTQTHGQHTVGEVFDHLMPVHNKVSNYNNTDKYRNPINNNNRHSNPDSFTNCDPLNKSYSNNSLRMNGSAECLQSNRLSAECLSNTDNNSSRCDMSEKNSSLTSLQWDNTGLRSNQSFNNSHNSSFDHSKTYSEVELLNQIKWLKRELDKSKNVNESNQLKMSTDSHMLAAYQQSIESLTARLEHEAKLNEEKERELHRLREEHPDPGTGGVKSTTLRRGGSYSDFSDCDNENPSHFDRSKKKRRSWKGSLTRAFSRKKKGWEDEWEQECPTKSREMFLSPEDLGADLTNYQSPHTPASDNKVANELCGSCQKHQAKIVALKAELEDTKQKNKPIQDSLVNYIRDEQSDLPVLYRIAVSIHCHNTQYTIGSVGITDSTSWRDLDNLTLGCLAKHLQLIDPGKQLGLRTSSIANYTLDTVTRIPNQEVCCEENVRSMRGGLVINLRSGCSCDNISYDALLPVSFVRIAQSTLKVQHFICLLGPRYVGKTYTAELIGKNLLEEIKPDSNDLMTHSVILYESDELQTSEAVERFHKRLSSSTQPVVAIVNDYADSKICPETIKIIKDSPGFKNSFIILISEESSHKNHLKDIRIVRCSAQCEPFQGLLDRHFNRVLAIQPPERRPKLKHIFGWLVSVWRHVNDTLKQHVDGQCLLGPTHFFSCPPDVNRAEEWFLGLWNMTLTPYIITTVKQGLQVYGRKHACWEDPVEFIKGSYPWTTSKDYCDLLQGVHSSELNFDSFRTGPLIGGSNALSPEQIEEVIACLKGHMRVSSESLASTGSPNRCPTSDTSALDPVPPARTTSVISSISSGSEDGVISVKPEERQRLQHNYPRHRQNGTLKSCSRQFSPPAGDPENYRQSPPRRLNTPPYTEQGFVTNTIQNVTNGQAGFVRGGVGRQSLPANMRQHNTELYNNMYYNGKGGSGHSAVQPHPRNNGKVYNNLGKV